MAAGDIITSGGVVFTPQDVEVFVSALLEKIQSTQKDPGQYREVTSLQGISSLPVFFQTGATYELVRVALSVLKGLDGKQVELQVTSTHIQWRLGDGAWNNLIALSDLKGADGGTPTFRTSSAGIEWKYDSEPDSAYKQLVGYDVLKLKFTDLTTEQKAEITGKTPVVQIGTVQSGATAAATVVPGGNDASGNPVTKINLTLPKGDAGKNPVIETGTVTTGAPGSPVTATLTPNGTTADGAPKYLLNLSIPKGDKGEPGNGAGNVLVNTAGLQPGKQYVFQPASAGSAEGTFVENVMKPSFVKDIQPENSYRLAPARFYNKSAVTGMVKITLPEQFNNTMWSVDLNIYDYASGKNAKVYVSGYTYSTSKKWTKASVLALGIEREVRVGNDAAGNACIFLGTVADVWNVLGISIESVFAFSSGATNIQNDIAIEIVSSDTGITYHGALFYNNHLFENNLTSFKPRQGLSAAQGKMLNENKVDKVAGKGLSTNDFTNVDKADIAALKNQMATVLGDSASSAIDKFNEIVSFLAGIQDTQTLDGIIAGIQGAIPTKLSQLQNDILSNDFTDSYKNYIDFLSGSNSVTTLANLPTSKRTVNATLSGATALSLSDALPEGRELMVRCTPTASFTQPIPNTGSFSSMSGASVQMVSGKVYEINIWSYQAGMYSIKVMEGE